MSNQFKMGGKKMVLDRGRYKESGNTGSQSTKKSYNYKSATPAKRSAITKAAGRIADGVRASAKKVQASANLRKAKKASAKSHKAFERTKRDQAGLKGKLQERKRQIEAASGY